MKELHAPTYAVSEEWEYNGPDDSDFYRVTFNPNTGELGRVMTGSTRFGLGSDSVRQFELNPPESVLAQAETALAEIIYGCLRKAEDSDTLEPRAASHGDRLRTIRNIRGKSACPAGTVGEVFWTGTYGTFYRNGYNRPGRDNTRVGLRLRDGTKVFVALSACRKDREPDSDEALRTRASELARNRNFYAAFRTSAVSLV